MPKVFVTRKIPQTGLDILLNQKGLEVEIWPEPLPPPREVLLQKVRGVDALYCLLTEKIDDALLNAAGPNLKVVSQMAVGVDNIDLAACTRRGIPVGNTPGVLTEATADLTLALMLATARQLLPAAAGVRAGEWGTWDPLGYLGPELFGSTVGIVGLGRIGLAVARRLQGFNARLLYNNRSPSPYAKEVGARFVELDVLLAESDFISLHCPLTPETRHLINADNLRKMKSDAILINTARGDVVDQAALTEALQQGVIAAAGLDVTSPEPILLNDPLLTLPNALVLPHIGSASIAARQKMATMAAENLLAGLRQERLPHCVNPEVYT